MDVEKLDEDKRLAALEGELIGTFAELQDRYGVGMVEISLSAAKAVLSRIRKHGDHNEMRDHLDFMAEFYTDMRRDLDALLDRARQRTAN